MMLIKKISSVTVLSFMLLLLNGKNNTEAGIIKFINNTRKPAEINVISPFGEPYCKKCILRPDEMYGKEIIQIIVPSEAFFGREFFSIIDVTHGFLGAGQCNNLSVLKNYEVSFFETTLGTRCQSKEM